MATTWDGIEIAGDFPNGATVCVRRTGADGCRDVLLLHRAHHGRGYDGDWAWTSPAGARQPGEPVYPAALRELAEEAGIQHAHPWAVDVSGPWALFALDVAADTEVSLVDPEHDRYEWVPAEVASARILPSFIAEQQARAARPPNVTLTFRPMVEADLAGVASWQSTPHVSRWWHARSRDEAAVRARYLPRLRGDEPTRMWIVEVDGEPVGFLQDYLVGDHPDYAVSTQDPTAVGFDYAIGEAGLVGQGIGTRMVWEFCRDVLRRDHPDAVHLVASPSHRNATSLRVLEKCGFTQGLWIDEPGRPGEPADTEIVCTLDVLHWFGHDGQT